MQKRSDEAVVPALAALAVVTAAVWPATTEHLGILLCLVVIVLRVGYLRLDLLAWSLTGFVVLQFASLSWSVDPDLTRVTAMGHTLALLHFVAVRLACRTLRGTLVVCGVVALCAPLILSRQLRSTTEPASEVLRLGSRLAAPDVNPNYYAYGLVTVVWLVLVLWRLVPGRAVRSLSLLSLACCLAGIVLAGTRGAGLSVALVAVWVGAARLVSPRQAFRTAVGVTVASAVVVSAGWLDRLLSSGVIPMSRPDGDLSGRLVVWPLARSLVEERPWLGTGAGTFSTFNPFHIVAHNVVLETATGLGVAGIAILALILLGTVRSTDTRSALSTQLMGAYLLALLPVLISGAWSPSPVFWASLAIAAEVARHTALGAAPGGPVAQADPVTASSRPIDSVKSR